MDGGEFLGIRLSFWDDAVGAFEPAKVVGQLRRAFPAAEIDATDTHRTLLQRELELFSRPDVNLDSRETMIRQAWGSYQRNGPRYQFVVPFPSGHRVRGAARRLCVSFWVPHGLSAEHREQLLAFLQSLRMGEPKLYTARK
jgi:hypothetical protein